MRRIRRLPQPGGCTYRARSQAGARGLNADFAEAVWRLQEALQHTLNTPTILNSLGSPCFMPGKGMTPPNIWSVRGRWRRHMRPQL